MCNQPVEWQTKQGPQALSTMTADQLADDVITNGDGSEDWVHWHTWCGQCRLWTEVRTEIRRRQANPKEGSIVTYAVTNGPTDDHHRD